MLIDLRETPVWERNMEWLPPVRTPNGDQTRNLAVYGKTLLPSHPARARPCCPYIYPFIRWLRAQRNEGPRTIRRSCSGGPSAVVDSAPLRFFPLPCRPGCSVWSCVGHLNMGFTSGRDPRFPSLLWVSSSSPVALNMMDILRTLKCVSPGPISPLEFRLVNAVACSTILWRFNRYLQLSHTRNGTLDFLFHKLFSWYKLASF